MKNHITASVEFYFKGEKFNASIEIDLDLHMNNTGALPNLYPLFAQTLNLDPYSYEFEMMQAETIIFSNAQGLAIEHLNDWNLNFESFKKSWHEHAVFEKLQDIAQRNLAVDNLQNNSNLKNALFEAFQLGDKTKNS